MVTLTTGWAPYISWSSRQSLTEMPTGQADTETILDKGILGFVKFTVDAN